MAPHLLSIPPELRVQIFSWLFQGEKVQISGQSAVTTDDNSEDAKQQGLPPLLFVCKQLASEARPIYFAKLSVELEFSRGNPPKGLVRWLEKIGNNTTQLLRRLEIKWSRYVNVTVDLSHRQRSVEDAPFTAETSSTGAVDSTANIARKYPVAIERLWGIDPFARNAPCPIAICPTPERSLPFIAIPALTSMVDNLQDDRRPFECSADPLHPAVVQNLDSISCPFSRFSCSSPPASPPVAPASACFGTRHSVSVTAISNHLYHEFWDRMGTAEFCHELSAATSKQVELLLSSSTRSLSRTHGLSIAELVQLVRDVDQHATKLQWLWFW